MTDGAHVKLCIFKLQNNRNGSNFKQQFALTIHMTH